MKSFAKVLVMLAVSITGCGGGGAEESTTESSDAETNNITSTADMKSALESIAQSGETGSAAMGFRDTLEGLKQTDAAKADALLLDLEKLESSTSQAETKKIAKQMADKL